MNPAHAASLGEDHDAITPGMLVEMTDIFVTTDVADIRAYIAQGNKRPPGLINGRDCFGVSIGEEARVLGREGEVVKIELLGGSWKGRIGWVGLDSVRVPPNEVESTVGSIGGLTLLARRQIYAAMNQVGFASTAEAGALFPFEEMPADAEENREYLDGRKAVYDAALERGRRDLLARYGIDESQLARVEAEGDEGSWPSWDGLADDRGPIPTFGPARTDPQGRIVIDEQERDARRDASIRALGAIGQIADETDTDEVWGEMPGGFEGAH